MRKSKKQSSYKKQRYFKGVPSKTDIGSNKKGRGAPSSNAYTAKLVGILVFAGILSIGLLVGYVDSATVEVTRGFSPYKQSELETRVQSYLDSGIQRRLKPFISSSGLTAHLRETHPDISNAVISVSPISPKATVSIYMRTASLIWENESGARLVVDDNGVAYAPYDEEIHGTIKVITSDATQPSAAVSDVVLSSQIVSFVQNLDAAVQSQTTIKSRKYVFPLAAREVQLKLSNYDVRFSLDRYEEEQALELSQLLKNLNNRGVTPVNYIDLRAEDRAYYK